MKEEEEQLQNIEDFKDTIDLKAIDKNKIHPFYIDEYKYRFKCLEC